jgi:hypothetical protein
VFGDKDTIRVGGCEDAGADFLAQDAIVNANAMVACRKKLLRRSSIYLAQFVTVHVGCAHQVRGERSAPF